MLKRITPSRPTAKEGVYPKMMMGASCGPLGLGKLGST